MKGPSSSSAAMFERAPLPVPSALTAGFWEAAHREVLVIQRCDECGSYRHYPQYRCPGCHSAAWRWTPVSGRGQVHSFTVTYQPFGAAWASRLPYAVATVELEEGVRMLSDLPDEDVPDVAIGRLVEVFFEHQEEITLPRFRLVR
jgi:uncharacterized protein